MSDWRPSARSLAKIYECAHAILPDEACGFIHLCGQVILMPNTAPFPRRYFEMATSDILTAYEDADRSGCGMAAVWHSHPNGSLHWSERDRRFWVPNLVNILVANTDVGWQAIYH